MEHTIINFKPGETFNIYSLSLYHYRQASAKLISSESRPVSKNRAAGYNVSFGRNEPSVCFPLIVRSIKTEPQLVCQHYHSDLTF